MLEMGHTGMDRLWLSTLFNGLQGLQNQPAQANFFLFFSNNIEGKTGGNLRPRGLAWLFKAGHVDAMQGEK